MAHFTASTAAIEHDRNRVLLQAVEDEYRKIKFRNGNIDLAKDLDDFTISLVNLLAACKSDPTLCEEVTKQYIIEHMMIVTDILHSNHACDSVCLEFLALLATTESGAKILFSSLPQITRWANSSNNAAFQSKALPVLRNVQETMARKEASLQETARREGKESLATLQLEHSLTGILLDTTKDGLRRRVRALPQLYTELPRNQFCGIFPKSCPGCIGLNLICAAEVLNDSQLVWGVVKDMLNDPPGEIMTIDELDYYRTMSRLAYHRQQGNPYPYMGNCVDFRNNHTPMVNVATGLGELLSSPNFALAMKRNRSKCIQYVTAKFSGKTKEGIEDFCKTVL